MRCVIAGIALVVVFLTRGAEARQPADPFAFFGPSAVLGKSDREHLARGRPVVRTVPARGQSVAIFATVPIAIDGDRLLAWVRDIAAFKHGPPVQQVGRFSDPPRMEDLATLTFPNGDFEDLRDCRTGDCALKITPAEMETMRPRLTAASPVEQQDVLRALVFLRVQSYLASNGDATARFSSLVDESGFLRERLPAVAQGIKRGRGSNGNGTETFLYWAKEHYGGKPIVSVTQVFVVPGGNGCPEALIISRQIFATHYIDAWLGVTALVRDPETGQAYFVYIVRTSLDVLRGFWGGLVRHVLQRRLKSEGVALIEGIRRRLERGMPPVAR